MTYLVLAGYLWYYKNFYIYIKPTTSGYYMADESVPLTILRLDLLNNAPKQLKMVLHLLEKICT